MQRLHGGLCAGCAAATLMFMGNSAAADVANASERFETVQYLAPSDIPSAQYVHPSDISPADRLPTRDFGPTLDPYGTWRVDAVYGTAWVPNVAPGFVPYATSGYWSTDPNGEPIWVSDYPWGDLVFHYGSWVNIPSIGWAWVPGYQYAPAWVTWSEGNPGWDFVGWAPLGPTLIWRGGALFDPGFPLVSAFVFVPFPHFRDHFAGGLHHRFLIVDRDRTRFIRQHAHFGDGPKLAARFGLSWGGRDRAGSRRLPPGSWEPGRLSGRAMGEPPRRIGRTWDDRAWGPGGSAPLVRQQRPFVKRTEPFVNRTPPFVKRTEPFVNRTPPFVRGGGTLRPLAQREAGVHHWRGGGTVSGGHRRR